MRTFLETGHHLQPDRPDGKVLQIRDSAAHSPKPAASAVAKPRQLREMPVIWTCKKHAVFFKRFERITSR